MKDSFEAVDCIHSIPPELFDEGYHYISFDVTSLFTNVPLNRTIKIILKRVYEEKLVKTNLKKKLIKDSCSKTAFMFNGKIYKQIDGVSMGSSLGPVLANVIMTEFEKIIVNKLITDGIIKFYIRYVDDTLVLAKEKDIVNTMKEFNSFDKNIKFTMDKFDDGIVHFLDIKINRCETDLYYKSTHIGQYSDFLSQNPWRLKTSWIKALNDRATKICSSNELLTHQINKIKTFMSWNNYPKYVRDSFIKRLQKKSFRVPYLGTKGEGLVKSYIQKLKRCVKTNVKFVILYDTKKVQCFALPKIKFQHIKSLMLYVLLDALDVATSMLVKQIGVLLQ